MNLQKKIKALKKKVSKTIANIQFEITYKLTNLKSEAKLFLGIGRGQSRNDRTLAQVRVLLLVIVALLATGARAEDCDKLVGGKQADCKVVKVLTKCDMDKYKLQKRIEELRRQLKAAEAQAAKIETKVVEKEVVVEKKVVVTKTETKVKKHIISIFGHPAATNTTSTTYSNSGSATAKGSVDMEYVPGLMYQYQFDMGLVPMIGIDTKKQLIFGLGFEF